MRVLVVEDNAPIQKAVAKGLREAGFAVDVSGDGEEGLWYATSNDYDVVVLDLMLPRVDGLTILKRLRADGRSTHVLILTARDTVQDRVLGLDLGAGCRREADAHAKGIDPASDTRTRRAHLAVVGRGATAQAVGETLP